MIKAINYDLNGANGKLLGSTEALVKFTLTQETIRITGRVSEYMALNKVTQVSKSIFYYNSVYGLLLFIYDTCTI